MTTMQEYNDFVYETKHIPEDWPIIYPVIGMMGEAGEVSEKVKKWMRKGKKEGDLDKLEVVKELGDVLWYLTSLAGDLGYTLEDVVNINVIKLRKRREENTIKGEGDNR